MPWYSTLSSKTAPNLLFYSRSIDQKVVSSSPNITFSYFNFHLLLPLGLPFKFSNCREDIQGRNWLCLLTEFLYVRNKEQDSRLNSSVIIFSERKTEQLLKEYHALWGFTSMLHHLYTPTWPHLQLPCFLKSKSSTSLVFSYYVLLSALATQ